MCREMPSSTVPRTRVASSAPRRRSPTRRLYGAWGDDQRPPLKEAALWRDCPPPDDCEGAPERRREPPGPPPDFGAPGRPRPPLLARPPPERPWPPAVPWPLRPPPDRRPPPPPERRPPAPEPLWAGASTTRPPGRLRSPGASSTSSGWLAPLIFVVVG